MTMLKFYFFLHNTLPSSTVWVYYTGYIFFPLIKFLPFRKIFLKEKLSKPYDLQKRSPHIEMLKPLAGTTDIKHHVLRQVYATFFLSRPSRLPHSLRQNGEHEKSVTHTPAWSLWNSCTPRRLVHGIPFLPAQITIIRKGNDWEFKVCFFYFHSLC